MHTSSHSRRGDITLLAVLGKHERSTAMRDGEVRGAEGSLAAGLQLVLERAFVHVVDEVVWARTELDTG